MNRSISGLPIHHQLPSLLKLVSISWWCHPAISSSVVPFSPAPNPFQHQGLFQWVNSSHEVAKVLEFQLHHQSFQWTPRTDLFRIDLLDFLAVQGTFKNLLQHHSSKASNFQCSAFVTVQLSHPYMTTGKTITLTRWTFVGKIISLLFNILSGLVITFLPRSKCLLIPWLQSPYAVILESPKNKVWHCFPIYFPWNDGTRCHDLSFLNVEF